MTSRLRPPSTLLALALLAVPSLAHAQATPPEGATTPPVTGVTSGALTGALAAEWAILGKPVTVPNAARLVPDRLSRAA